jgi:calcium-dependent protein kinase
MEEYHYQVGEQLGEGGYGVVLRCLHTKTGMHRAMKIVRKASIIEVDKLRFEVDTHCLMEHPNVAKLFEYFEDDQSFCLIMELCEGPELFDRICANEGSFTATDTASWIDQMARGLHYCHSRNIIHRDVKPENFLFSSTDDASSLKLIDFGISRKYVVGSNNFSADTGTVWYQSPEMFMGQFEAKSDVWGLGCILFILLVGYPPFPQRYGTCQSRIMAGEWYAAPEDWEKLDPDAQELVKLMPCVDAGERISMDQVFQHRFVTKHFSAPDVAEGAKWMATQQFKFVSKVKHFAAMSKFSRAALNMFARIVDEEDEELQRLWKLLDVESRGEIPYAKLSGFLPILPPGFQEKCEKADISKDGVLTYTEFRATMLDASAVRSRQHCEAAFQAFANGDHIDNRSLANALGGNLEEDVCTRMIEEAGGEDGQLDFDGFVRAISAALSENPRAGRSTYDASQSRQSLDGNLTVPQHDQSILPRRSKTMD